MSAFVVDTSVTMAWCFEDEADEYADLVLDRLIESEAWAPAIWPLEVANVLLGAERERRLRPADAARFLDLLGKLKISVEHPHPREAWPRLLAVGREHSLSAYDAGYLELAMRRGLPLATRDDALREACREAGVELLT